MELLPELREAIEALIPEGEVGCKICEKSIHRIFTEHIQEHLDKTKVSTEQSAEKK